MSAGGVQASRKLRLFFGLWPSDRHRAALAAAAAGAMRQVDGQVVPPANLHVTLAFLGMVAGSLLVRLIEVGGRGPWPAIALSFRRIEYWVKPRALIALPESVPPTGPVVVDRLWQGLEPLGFTRELRPWHPHLTLMRRIRRPPPAGLAMASLADGGSEPAWRLALVESSSHPDGVRYKPLADWPLT